MPGNCQAYMHSLVTMTWKQYLYRRKSAPMKSFTVLTAVLLFGSTCIAMNPKSDTEDAKKPDAIRMQTSTEKSECDATCPLDEKTGDLEKEDDEGFEPEPPALPKKQPLGSPAADCACKCNQVHNTRL